MDMEQMFHSVSGRYYCMNDEVDVVCEKCTRSESQHRIG